METFIGKTGIATRVVTEKDTAIYVKSGTLPVLATPVLSAIMEEAAVAATAPFLNNGETTVGGSIYLTHKAPTKVGDKITALATITEVKGRKITCHITARDSQKEIGEADHVRFIVNSELFMKKI